MTSLRLEYVVDHSGASAVLGVRTDGVTFTSITNHSSEARPGALFLALEGARDGHEFIAAARAAGASGVLARRVLPDQVVPEFAYIVVDDPLLALQRIATAHRIDLSAGVIGITGSVGKTSTKEAVAQVLRHRFSVHASQGNFNNEIGLPISLLDANDTHDRLVLEMGAYNPGEIATLCAIARPQIGIVTTVGPTHLESFGSIDTIEQSKGELIDALPDTGLAILNGDDDRVRAIARRAACPVVLYGTGDMCLVRASRIESRGLEGIAFTLEVPGARARVESPLIGAHSVYACLAAAAVGLADEMEVEVIAAALAEPPIRLRLRPIAGRNGALVLDDSYNAAPISMRAALEVLAGHDGRRIAILGDMLELGEIEEEAHREVGHQVAAAGAVLYAVGPRGRWIAEAARSAGLREVHLVGGPDEVDFTPEPGDLVLVKGSRGMALERVVERLVERPD